MKKITLLFMMFCLTLSSKSLIAQTNYSVSMNGGTVYVSNPGSFAGYGWNGVGNHVFNNTNSTEISLSITDYDETNPEVGSELYIRFSRVGFGNAPLGWGSDNSTNLATLVPGDFTGGAATVKVDIPTGTLPVAQTADYVSGYLWVLQIVGANTSGQTYINYVVDIEQEILSAKEFNKSKLQGFYSASKDAIVFKDKIGINGDFSIYNLMGQSVLKGEVVNEISVETLKSGLYFLTTEKGVLKFVK